MFAINILYFASFSGEKMHSKIRRIKVLKVVLWLTGLVLIFFAKIRGFKRLSVCSEKEGCLIENQINMHT